MTNRSLFAAAIDELTDAKAKFAEVETKVATLQTIYTRMPAVDPLDNPAYGPDRKSIREQSGRNIGRIVGGLGGALAGGYLGHETGNALVDNNITEVGGGLIGGAAGALAGRALGGGIGAGLSRVTASREEQAAEHIRKLDPATGLAHIRMTEQMGHATPSELQAMKDAYNARRIGLRTQRDAGVPIPPGHAPVNISSNRPNSLPV